MIEKGISVYTGLGYSVNSNMTYLKQAQELGFTRVFTSLHIPEANQQHVFSEFKILVNFASQLGLKVTADVSRRSLNLIFNHISDVGIFLKKIGLWALRLDYGFDTQEISRLHSQAGLNVELNASIVCEEYLNSLILAELDLSKLQACHNYYPRPYYPRPETDLSYALFKERSAQFNKHNIPVAAFIPAKSNPRGPIFAGLPTLEGHRSISSIISAKHLLACKEISCIIIGDPFASEEELKDLSNLNTNYLEFEIAVEPKISIIEQCILLKNTHCNRLDPGEFVIRSTTARRMYPSTVPARHPLARPRGTVTVDNEKYGRYMSELQITLIDLPPDDRVNVIGRINTDELFLLYYIKPGECFSFSAIVPEANSKKERC